MRLSLFINKGNFVLNDHCDLCFSLDNFGEIIFLF